MAVLNKHHHGGQIPQGAVNIMRGTLFGNPFVIGRDGDRTEVVEKYRQYLWKRIREDYTFMNAVYKLHGRDLCCCCAPAACHGHVLERAAAWLELRSRPAEENQSDAPAGR
ncbi:hypothetical protein FHR70_000716 [Microvirga lupini]|uniref:DUF4326 domain-containing protein n=1 Tax=Microvirga lupini TaxID=420324 RepID=A0A7W4YVA3_9HYPH|nr:DUF4326 domain-containing protein [Microvirga lupini]MBB3017676.1 hypothetical protein [Microvirga lupini]